MQTVVTPRSDSAIVGEVDRDIAGERTIAGGAAYTVRAGSLRPP